ncbi:MAG: hypothetical protein J0I77_04825 [Rudaea sp.]|uniref:hypothetical protein n=1 Tax=unclassified Rudaea TaxID=2627037 RepID=UPI0010F73D7A|nr:MULTISPECIES: hypothetical protein [unclassified Rudaea]MBN8885019.1 hypothetical protein [Rudaea sp.]
MSRSNAVSYLRELQSRRHRSRAIALLLLIVTALAGCSSSAVLLGLRTRLQNEPVTQISASLGDASGLAPGHSAQLVIVASTSDGKQLTTTGAGHGKVLFDSFTFDTRIAQVSEDGVVSLPADPRLSRGQLPHIHIGVVGHPNVVADLDVLVRYDVAFVADFSGKAGTDGMDGMNGTDGSAGSDGSIDPSNPSAGPGAGGRGGDGDAGKDGDNGQPGQPGEAVQIWVRLDADSPQLLQVRVAGDHQEKWFLVDPNGGSLTVKADGGPGGRGGKGGRGGQGGRGGSGFPSGLAGTDGRNGWDGTDGRAGKAGTLLVSIDPAALAYKSSLVLSNKDGNGTPGPAPQFHVESLAAPLW